MRGADKLLEDVDGQPILRRTALEALGAALGPVVVGLRPKDPARRKALRNLPVDIIEVKDSEAGMSATLKAGATRALKALLEHSEGVYEYSGMCVLLPDMPGVRSADLKALNIAFQGSGGPIVRATTPDGLPGHPVVVPTYLLHDFNELTGDRGAAAMFEGERVVTIPLPGDRATRDLDTPEDWADWRAGR